nr:glycoside hydrolase family 43 protein [Paenibacillus turpanensis]
MVFPVSAGFWNLSGDFVAHDPSIIQVGSTWHVFSTGQGIQRHSSTNGTNWTRGSQVFAQPLSWWKQQVPNQATNDIWAPDIKYFNGRYWLYYSVSSFGSNTSAIGLASATNLNGPWRDDGLVVKSTSANNYNAIDPDLFIDPQGNPWLSFGSFWSGLKLTRLDASTMKPTGALHSIATRPSTAIEAPAITYRNGYYYLFASIDRCCQGVNSTYKMIYGRSTSITGPYVDKNGVSLMNGGGTILDSGNSRWKGPGGQDVLGTSLIIRHAYDADDNGTPKFLINDLLWDSSGWPSY